MDKKETKHPVIDQEGSICTVEAIVSIDERGQMVLPKDLRKRAGIKASEKLAITSWQRDGEICCLTITKVDGLGEMLKIQLAPVMKEAL